MDRSRGVLLVKTVMAQGTFDILHPGHLHYLRKSAQQGDKLVVVVARDTRVNDRKDLHFNESERQEMLSALDVTDEVILGSEGDIYSTVTKVDPDTIVLGHDQHHDEKEVKEMAESATGHAVDVKRASGLEGYSSSNVRT
jgi:FAD synthetase